MTYWVSKAFDLNSNLLDKGDDDSAPGKKGKKNQVISLPLGVSVHLKSVSITHYFSIQDFATPMHALYNLETRVTLFSCLAFWDVLLQYVNL